MELTVFIFPQNTDAKSPTDPEATEALRDAVNNIYDNFNFQLVSIKRTVTAMAISLKHFLNNPSTTHAIRLQLNHNGTKFTMITFPFSRLQPPI